MPMLQVLLQVVQQPDGGQFDPTVSVLGLNDIVYVVPEFNPSDYDKVYPEQDIESLQNANFDAFF